MLRPGSIQWRFFSGVGANGKVSSMLLKTLWPSVHSCLLYESMCFTLAESNVLLYYPPYGFFSPPKKKFLKNKDSTPTAPLNSMKLSLFFFTMGGYQHPFLQPLNFKWGENTCFNRRLSLTFFWLTGIVSVLCLSPKFNQFNNLHEPKTFFKKVKCLIPGWFKFLRW